MDASVVILNYNVKDLLRGCVDTIFKYTKNIEFEVIVVDSGSADGSPETIRELAKKYPLKTLFSKENLGYTKGNNVGIKLASGKYILVLNPDTLFVENTLKIMFAWMEGHPDVAVSSCQLLDSEQKISPTGGYFPTLPRVLFWALFLDDIPFIADFFQSYHPQQAPTFKTRSLYQKEFFPDWVTGAFFFVRKAALQKVGMLDENIFMYGEDLEWCLRIKSAGWRIAYTPATKIVHLERRSSGGLPRNAVFGEFRGLKYLYGKHYPGWKQIVLGTLLDIAAFLRIIFWLVRLKPAMAKIYLEALFL